MSKGQTTLDKFIDEKITTGSNNHNYEFFSNELERLSHSKEDKDITINDSKNNYFSNLMAMRELIKFAKNEIRIYTSDLSDDMYGNNMIISTLIDWLQEEDDNRKLYILVRKKFDIKNKKFYSLAKKFNEQIIIRRINLKNAEECQKNAVIIDNQAIKLKKIDNDSIEYVTINFGARDMASRLVSLFDIHFNNNNNSFSLSSKPTNSFVLPEDYMGQMVSDILENKKYTVSNAG